MSIFGFLFGAYLIYRDLALKFIYTGYSISFQSSIFNAENINLNPTIMLIMIVILFIISFFYSNQIFRVMEQTHILRKDRILNGLIYMLIYLTLYPMVWFDAIYKIIKKEHKW
jgi:hypothetical protein